MEAENPMRAFRRRITREQFILRSIAAGVTMPTLASLLAACGSDDGGKTTAARAAGRGDVPQVGTFTNRTPAARGPLDRATWGLYYEPSTLFWVRAYAPVDNTVVTNVTESLMRLTPEFTYEPSLAERMDTPDPTTYVFTIRQGVRFHDGSEMTADDVVYSIERSREPSSYWAPWLTSVDTVQRTGEWEVTVKLKQPDVLFPQMMALPPGAVGSRRAIEAGGDNYGGPKALPVGTGPFKVASWTAGTSIVLVRNDDYWDKDHQPLTSRIEFSFISDSSAMINALTSGELSGAYNLPYEALGRLISNSTGKLYQGPSMMNAIMLWTTRRGPQLDPRVRRAWLLATDRTAIARSVYNDAAAPLPATFVPLPMWGYVRDEARRAYEALDGPQGDLEQAKALIAEVGEVEPMKIAIKATDLDERMGTILQASAESIGLRVELVKLPAADVVNLLYDERARTQYNAFVTGGYYGDLPDPLELIEMLIGAPKEGALSYNYLGYENREVQDLIAKARETEDENERGRMLLEVQEKMSPDVPVFPIVAPASLVYLNNEVTGPPAAFCYLYYPWARDLGAA